MMEVMKLVLYVGLCTCFMAVRGKLLENPPCLPSEVQLDNTCETCTRPEQSGVCHPGYKCLDVATENSLFSCSYTRLRGWEKFSNQYDITVFKLANQSSPLPLISTIYVYQRNQTNSPYGYPALNVKVNVPYMLYGPGSQNEVPKSLRMVFSSVEDAEYRDSYYYNHHITRFYRFSAYRPTSSDVLEPQQVQFKCLTGLDVCGKMRVYNVQLTTYTAPQGSLYIEQNFTVTAYMDEPKWFPVIATAVLPNNSVYVVFNPRHQTGVTHEVYLESNDGHRKGDIHNFPRSVQKYVCVFHNIEPGTYRAQLLVKYTKHQTEPVAKYQSAPLVIPGETSDTGTSSTISNPALVLPILVIVSFVIASILLVLLYWQRKNNMLKFFCRWSTNHKEPDKRAFLLYLREAEKFVPCVTDFLKKKLMVVSDKDWENNHSSPLKLFQEEIKLCSHLLVLWSPLASGVISNLSNQTDIEISSASTVQDYFKEAITFSEGLHNLSIVVLYIPKYADRTTVSKNIGEKRMFDLTGNCKQLLKYLTDDASNLNDIKETALDEQITRILNPPHEGDQVEFVDDECPVIDRKKLRVRTNDLYNFNTDCSQLNKSNGHHNKPGSVSGHHMQTDHYTLHRSDNNCSGQCISTTNYNDQLMAVGNCCVKTELDHQSSKPLLSENQDSDHGYISKSSLEYQERLLSLCAD